MTDARALSKSFDEDGLQFAWNSSSIKLAEACLRKYQYVMIEGWQSARPSPHLRFGGHFATALEHYHKHIALGMDPEDALYEVVHEALVATWEYDPCEDCAGTGNEYHDPDKANAKMQWAGGNVTSAHKTCETCDGTGKKPGSGHPWDSMHNTKTRGNLIRSIVWYIDHYSDDTMPVVQLEDGPAVELSFTLEVDDGMIFAGHLDRLVHYGDDPYVQDQKTTGSTINQKFFEQFKPDTQMSMYSFAGKMILGTPVKGVIIDGAQIAVGFTRFERGFTFRTDGELNEWYDSAMYHIEQARHATRENFFPMNTTSCGDYGGCPFRHVCARSPEHRLQFLKADFVQGQPLDPLEQR